MFISALSLLHISEILWTQACIQWWCCTPSLRVMRLSSLFSLLNKMILQFCHENPFVLLFILKSHLCGWFNFWNQNVLRFPDLFPAWILLCQKCLCLNFFLIKKIWYNLIQRIFLKFFFDMHCCSHAVDSVLNNF